MKLLEYASENHLVLITLDKKDFGGKWENRNRSCQDIIHTDPMFLRQSPEKAVHVLDLVLEHYPVKQLTGNRVWLNQWRNLR